MTCSSYFFFPSHPIQLPYVHGKRLLKSGKRWPGEGIPAVVLVCFSQSIYQFNMQPTFACAYSFTIYLPYSSFHLLLFHLPSASDPYELSFSSSLCRATAACRMRYTIPNESNRTDEQTRMRMIKNYVPSFKSASSPSVRHLHSRYDIQRRSLLPSYLHCTHVPISFFVESSPYRKVRGCAGSLFPSSTDG